MGEAVHVPHDLPPPSGTGDAAGAGLPCLQDPGRLRLSQISKKNPPKLVLVASSASEGSKKKLFTKCEFYEIKAVQLNMSAEELGSLLGKSFAPVTLGIMDEGFASEIIKAIGEEI